MTFNQEFRENNTPELIGLGFVVPMWLYSLVDFHWVPFTVFTVALGGIVYGLINNYIKAKNARK